MKKMSVAAFALLALVFMNVSLAHSQDVAPDKTAKTKTVDVNKDGTPDVTYYSEDGKNVTKAEADTNYDGKPDVVVNVKDGNFQSAEIDTDHNGSMDKEIQDATQFKQWINTNRPEFKETIGRSDWQEFGSMNF